jgi:hypothetical protein
MTALRLFAAALPAMLTLLLAFAARADGVAPRVFPDCTSAGLRVGDWGSKQLAAYADGSGRGVEVWCVRGMIAGHYDIRVTWDEPGIATPANVRHVKTFAGCYFKKGENHGPDIAQDSAHAFTRVTWTNLNKREAGTGYVFSYDWATKKLTITATAAGKPPAVSVVDPPDDFAALQGMLPSP